MSFCFPMMQKTDIVNIPYFYQKANALLHKIKQKTAIEAMLQSLF